MHGGRGVGSHVWVFMCDRVSAAAAVLFVGRRQQSQEGRGQGQQGRRVEVKRWQGRATLQQAWPRPSKLVLLFSITSVTRVRRHANASKQDECGCIP